MTTTHETYMKRCLQLAANGLPAAMPNPSVGAVIVHNHVIIGEGYTSAYGGHHAEVNAIRSVKDKSLLKEATIYVSLEPCSHFGKTPPCSDLIIEHQIPKVVIGTIDPFAKVAGKGIAKLQNSGCEVTLGVLESECIASNKRFFTFHQHKRPYIILKWAMSQDGFIDKIRTKKDPVQPNWITNTYSRQLVHKWRSEEAAILVGTHTAITDNPKLNTRDWYGDNPVRVVLDKSLRIPQNYSLFDESIKTIVLTAQKVSSKENLVFETIDFSKNVAQQVCNVLYRHELQSVIIEGGKQTLQTFIDANLWDEARVFTGNVWFENGIKAPDFHPKTSTKTSIIEDTLQIFHND
ncbi:bifunctional diaminohydroxyphosphoribosylaminopyrimidine deaminase/5-amino-6-(5-phosphoribosylamino)uracil reductase RibD [Kordia zhangzhouensis]|uniref:bifunctional diaminohydroxyphosphoribosylaminopyrimidine deaminase/5-amino-6-(5-phosphoribosylamino)uracil reductase RibD n=1 Tax=Kordia zhangzhouensis TaxID=1620405 RepID=UPI0006290676|nr:bifunctional diaminohydroxyphosphoribosylaminopyrimidine deaminase/5-amino-6-(5-phosphoribosylamino)uracil reductase RibD [Kordia zhangzhouensis]